MDNIRTRRRFLEQLGLIGGSSLVMTALQSWDLMAGQAGVRPSLSGKPSNGTKVLILGAGDSGMVVGYELGKLGYDYQILEARDRVGGLAFTARSGVEHTEIGGEKQVCNFAPGQYQNMGPWRLPYTHTGVLNYCREVGVQMEMFQNECDNSYFYYEGDQWGPLANKRVRLRQVKADMWGYTNEMIAKALDQKKLDVALSAEDKDRFMRFLVNAGFLDSSSKAYKGFPPADENPALPLAAILEAGFDSRVRSAPSTDGTTAAPIFQPVGGMDMFAKGLERAMLARDGQKRIQFNAEVQSVHQDDTGVKVVYADSKNGMKKHEIRADYVVVCLPMTIVSKLDINLSDDIMKIAKTVNHSESAKVALATKRRFWEEDDQIFGGHLYSNLPLGEFSYPSYGYYGKKGVLLGLYVNGASFNAPSPTAAGRGGGGGGAQGGGRGGGGANAPTGRGDAAPDAAAAGRGGAGGGGGRGGAPANTLYRDLGNQPVAARVEHVLTHTSKVHPQVRTELESSFAVWWKNVKYSEGSYATGLAAERRQTLSKLDNRIIIGSAAVCPYSAPDWQEGAVAAAWQALKAIHERAMKA
ncbi:MAG TPA: FAD-dependent oxidoreductase [Vicinamibacterales bacterium]|nr:FAD-dependent oxidoreductase [Vicinamibacterales bacterium]